MKNILIFSFPSSVFFITTSFIMNDSSRVELLIGKTGLQWNQEFFNFNAFILYFLLDNLIQMLILIFVFLVVY